jgi:type III secretory pathway component EscT
MVAMPVASMMILAENASILLARATPQLAAQTRPADEGR